MDASNNSMTAEPSSRPPYWPVVYRSMTSTPRFITVVIWFLLCAHFATTIVSLLTGWSDSNVQVTDPFGPDTSLTLYDSTFWTNVDNFKSAGANGLAYLMLITGIGQPVMKAVLLPLFLLPSPTPPHPDAPPAARFTLAWLLGFLPSSSLERKSGMLLMQEITAKMANATSDVGVIMLSVITINFAVKNDKRIEFKAVTNTDWGTELYMLGNMCSILAVVLLRVRESNLWSEYVLNRKSVARLSKYNNNSNNNGNRSGGGGGKPDPSDPPMRQSSTTTAILSEFQQPLLSDLPSGGGRGAESRSTFGSRASALRGTSYAPQQQQQQQQQQLLLGPHSFHSVALGTEGGGDDRPTTATQGASMSEFLAGERSTVAAGERQQQQQQQQQRGAASGKARPSADRSDAYHYSMMALAVATMSFYIPAFLFPVVEFTYSGLAASLMDDSALTLKLSVLNIPVNLFNFTPQRFFAFVNALFYYINNVVFPPLAVVLAIVLNHKLSSKPRVVLALLRFVFPFAILEALVIAVLFAAPEMTLISSWIFDASDFCVSAASGNVGESCLQIEGRVLSGVWWTALAAVGTDLYVVLTLRECGKEEIGYVEVEEEAEARETEGGTMTMRGTEGGGGKISDIVWGERSGWASEAAGGEGSIKDRDASVI